MHDLCYILLTLHFVVADFVAVGSATSATVQLPSGKRVFATVKAANAAGVSVASSSDGCIYDITPVNILSHQLLIIHCCRISPFLDACLTASTSAATWTVRRLIATTPSLLTGMNSGYVLSAAKD